LTRRLAVPPMTPETIRQIERELSAVPFRDVPLGSALAAHLLTWLYNGHGRWGLWNAIKDRAWFQYHYRRPRNDRTVDLRPFEGRVLLTWYEPNYRCRDLVLPVAERLGYDRCVVMFRNAEMESELPPGARGLAVGQAMDYDAASWRRDYRRWWKDMRPVVKRSIHRFALPSGVYPWLADLMVVKTQRIAGFLGFLERSKVAAVLTEFDRNFEWASLVLCAKTLGIPTYSLVHGVIGHECVGFYPLLADTIFCWGQFDRDKLLEAGLEPARAVIAGCPRLTRNLDASPAQARLKLGLDPARPVVMLGTDPFPMQQRLRLAETFCQAVRGQSSVSAVVRIHAVERIEAYKNLAAQYPEVTFLPNDACTLDEALAAADVVVVHSSGLGSDALVKRRLTVVLDAIDVPLGHGRDLADLAGCPLATSAESLREILLRLLADGPERRNCELAREEFVQRFCAFFGEEAARRIADGVRQGPAAAPARSEDYPLKELDPA
jgi:hypothetical protein